MAREKKWVNSQVATRQSREKEASEERRLKQLDNIEAKVNKIYDMLKFLYDQEINCPW